MKNINFGRRTVGEGCPVLVVAELSGNHNGSLERAIELVRVASDVGADAVKVQTYTPDTITLDCDNADFVLSGTAWNGRKLYDLYEEAMMPWDWQPRLQEEAEKLGMEFFSTAFDLTAVKYLEEMNVPVHKIASFELVDIPLIKTMAATGKPVIMSTGMASESEIMEAVEAVRSESNDNIVLLKCTSSYPALMSNMNIRTIPDMIDKFDVPVGISDHSRGNAASVASVAMGVCMVEKHITLSRSDGGPDSGFSLEPDEFASLVRLVRDAEQSLGAVVYGGTLQEEETRVFRRSIYASKDIEEGEEFSGENIRSVRPGHGLHPRYLQSLIGRKSARSIKKGDPLAWRDVQGGEEK